MTHMRLQMTTFRQNLHKDCNICKKKHQRTDGYFSMTFAQTPRIRRLIITTQLRIIFRQNNVLASIIRQQECMRPPMRFTFWIIMIIHCTTTVSRPKMFVAAAQQLMSVTVIFNFQYIQQSSIIYFTFSMHNNKCNSQSLLLICNIKIQHFYRCGMVWRLKTVL